MRAAIRDLLTRNAWFLTTGLPAALLVTAIAGACQTEIVAVGSGGAPDSSSITFIGEVTAVGSSGFATSGISATAATGPDACPGAGGGAAPSMTTAASTGSADPTCSFEASDGSHVWLAQCTVDGCNCLLDGQHDCACSYNQVPIDCAFGCCPTPWADQVPFP